MHWSSARSKFVKPPKITGLNKNPTFLEQGKDGVIFFIYQEEHWDVTCCISKDQLDGYSLGSVNVTNQNAENLVVDHVTIPTPPGPPTRAWSPQRLRELWM
jgi:hypothetical protein